jgi:hypothetical protein
MTTSISTIMLKTKQKSDEAKSRTAATINTLEDVLDPMCAKQGHRSLLAAKLQYKLDLDHLGHWKLALYIGQASGEGSFGCPDVQPEIFCTAIAHQ